MAKARKPPVITATPIKPIVGPIADIVNPTILLGLAIAVDKFKSKNEPNKMPITATDQAINRGMRILFINGPHEYFNLIVAYISILILKSVFKFGIIYKHMSYYTAFLIVVVLALALLSVLVSQNKRIKKEDKGTLYLTYAFVALAAFSEWFALFLNGKSTTPVWLLRLFKFFDYTLTPAAGGIIILQFRRKIPKFFIPTVFIVLGFNLIFQFVCLFNNWMISIDESITYTHGKLYYLYIVFYVVIILLAGVAFGLYGSTFRRQNRISLYCILAFVLAGIAIQIVFSVRTAYIALTIGLISLFIYNTEFTQMLADDQIEEQKILITTDPLTGIHNRYAFEKDIAEVKLAENFVVFSIDINGLKVANDSFGHLAGDELICGTAKVISEVYNKYGECYRTGGDEFIALSYISEEDIKKSIDELNKKVREWSGKLIGKMSLSIGYASTKEFPTYSIDGLISVADHRMYTNKSRYYIEHGIERRKQ